ncbi:ubiquitin carboxyl-terminal hydrolase 8 isoform X2 [Tribolium castaneum]|uniref:ubiquitin carboxyl-terminal hydrolase 8 isoform X2 n=1 Tax=Tribolium castaneum TaxID=7070 RepID=UPI00046BF59D|nr:PREDICTED: ubiquitin carboxyl-terminal hydrolase 8 isoform X2 [Tribolium castaneum]|eukprot:XP_008199367.1 PREDICTED: ubiquitin carboxyl-terminal hydrolase 8 isoform X2 [Tribolium castaneum]
MEPYNKLYLAKNLDSLDLLAKKDCGDLKHVKINAIYNSLNTLYKQSQLDVLDQEKTYILLARYLDVYSFLWNTESDKKFLQLRFGSEYEKVLLHYEKTKKSLEERYALLANDSPATPQPEETQPQVAAKPSQVFDSEFISCQQLYSALQKNYKFLLVDARPVSDFDESRINHPDCINIPDEIIAAGLSANVLGKLLPDATREKWEMRDKYDVIVLFDWNTSSDNFAVTKLNKLHLSLVKWDLNRNYRERPVILKGGYLELLQTYPTLCINPQVYLYQKNNELDELLELDDITYPTETDNKTYVMGAPGDSLSDDTSGDQAASGEREYVYTRRDILNQLQHERNELKKIAEQCDRETNIKHIAELKQRDAEIQEEIVRLESLLGDYDKNMILDLGDESTEESSDTLKDIIDEERDRELQKARALKPKNQGPEGAKDASTEVPELDKPQINRSTKPSPRPCPMVEEVEITPGLVGLRNIRNTCYLNTIIHCFRNVPDIRDLFCKGIYTKFCIRNPAAIIHETANLVRQLWSRPVRSIDPMEFYTKIGELEPTYSLGHHEDCMEFLLFLLNHLCEDCRYDVSLPAVLTPRQKAWYNQFEGKNSIFIDYFYHQIRITQHCRQCDQKTFKFEIESTFMLPVPEEDFTLDELMSDYMADFIITEYCCSKCKKPVNNQKEIIYEPKIMVIVLKRQALVNGQVLLKKIESRAHFKKRDFRLGKSRYELNAFAMHSGNMNFGHYTAAALTSKGWYEFNDENVRAININDDSVKSKACVFFYSRSDD